MIDESEYMFPHKEPDKPNPNADPETLAYLENLPWRPIGAEW